MAKQSTTQRPSNKSKTVKHGKSKNHILKDHDLDKLIVPGKRKRVPTERALEAISLLKPSKKIKKVATKPKIKRLNTMQKTAKEGKAYLKDTTPTKRHSVSKSPEKEHSPKKSAATKATKDKKKVDRSRSRNTSKSQKKSSKSRSSSNKSKSRSKSTKSSKSQKSGKIKKTKTVAQTIHDASKILGDNHHHQDSEEEEHHDHDHSAKHATGKTAKKPNIKRTHTIVETIASAKAYLPKGPRSTSKGKAKK